MPTFPIAMIRDGVIQQIFYQAEQFTNPVDGVQHPMTAWSCWTETEWAAICAGLSFLPVLSNRPIREGFTYEPLHFRNWTIFEDRVEVTFTELEMTPEAKAVAEERIIAQRSAAVQAWMDAKARERNYEDVATCVTYADEPSVPRFQAEGQAARAWRSKVWEACYALLAEIKAGTRQPMSNAELIAALPALVWPDEAPP